MDILSQVGKHCSKCGEYKSLDSFHKSKNFKEGYKTICKACHKQQYKDYRSPSQQQKSLEAQQRKESLIQAKQSLKEKPCSKCGVVKPLDEFKKDPRHLDGRKSECKVCEYARAEQYRRQKGINPVFQPRKAGLLNQFIDQFDGVDTLIKKGCYLTKLCPKGHDWNGSGYTLHGKGGGCLDCSREYNQLRRANETERQRYFNWLKKPKLSLTVAELVGKQEFDYLKNKDYQVRKREMARFYSKKRYAENPGRKKIQVKKWKHANPQRVDFHNQKRIENMRLRNDGTVTQSAVDAILSDRTTCPYCSCIITPETATVDHIVPLAKGGLHSAINLVACCRSCNSRKGAKAFYEWVSGLPPSNQKICQRLYKQRYGTIMEQIPLPLTF